MSFKRVKKEKSTYAQKMCVGQAGKLMRQLSMLEPGSRVGVAVSGGVDSFVLLNVLRLRQRIVPFKFDVLALHVNPGFDNASHAPLIDWCASHGVALHAESTDHGPRAHSPENRKASACFFCAMLRRTRLFQLCEHYKLTHLAMGHNADDLVVTFFMNLFQTGKVQGLSASEPFFQGKLRMIRPLLTVEKDHIKRAARQWDLPIWANPCPSAGNTRRADFEIWLKDMFAKDKRFRANSFGALTRWQLDTAQPPT
ncbi:MAG: tRNA 2-thiocytidine biosynthesis protein TtcA [Desulfovibrio sp.]|jgi:tRNA(Ile)-lysidine synthase TilS/MesJ|nr:tRNA 2-thiocytidine biosynthesis protein TtcA [Desulfovibrio sp.]MBI4960008.1 tRNA 2-thiocytidine biosynthesis protein TtcA [Desulfovibrio sp.]